MSQSKLQISLPDALPMLNHSSSKNWEAISPLLLLIGRATVTKVTKFRSTGPKPETIHQSLQMQQIWSHLKACCKKLFPDFYNVFQFLLDF